MGVEPTSSAFAERCLTSRPQDHHGPSLKQPVLVSNQLDRGSEPQSPSEGLANREQGRVAGYDPAPRRSRRRMQSHYTIPTIPQHPRQESNLIYDLRKVVCEPAHSEDSSLHLNSGPGGSRTRIAGTPGQRLPVGPRAQCPCHDPFRPLRPGQSAARTPSTFVTRSDGRSCAA